LKSLLQYEPSSGFWLEQLQQYVKGESRILYLQDQQAELQFGERRLRVYGTPWTAIYGKPGKEPDKNIKKTESHRLSFWIY